MNSDMPKWKKRLRLERNAQKPLTSLTDEALRELINQKQLTSNNFDTVLSLDFPHYCIGATTGCGGSKGWCYTFQGFQSLSQHNSKVALVDLAARRIPADFSEKIVSEVNACVRNKELPYPNLRFSGSGEVTLEHIPALAEIHARGVILWGFSRNLAVAIELRKIGASVLFSCDNTTPAINICKAVESGFLLSYTSVSVDDHPPQHTFVVFPLHRSGTVREVVNSSNICPKVMEEYLHGDRRPAACQLRCNKCHKANN